jgi:dTDP-glucose 4,6-dehydratase
MSGIELNNRPWSIEEDLTNIDGQTTNIWLSLKSARLFITGGTGFIGCWLLESLRYANDKHQLGLAAVILTRNIKAFELKAPHLASYSSFTFIEGGVIDFEFPGGDFTHLIHAATDASADLNDKNPLGMFTTIVEGTRRVLDFAVYKKVNRTLFLSSGAVYGQQPSNIEKVSESYLGGPSPVDAKATYAEGKRAAEMLCAIYQKQFGLKISIARIFALLGPYLSLDIHFAAGNFIRDAMQGKEIIINGNGLPSRSYLYASDLTVWLWHLLVHGLPGKPYNVGSDVGITVRDLATKISKELDGNGVEVLGKEDGGWNLGRYVPDTSLIEKDLGLTKMISLEQAIIRTALWHGWKVKK